MEQNKSHTTAIIILALIVLVSVAVFAWKKSVQANAESVPIAAGR